jgi:hypothetical protein
MLFMEAARQMKLKNPKGKKQAPWLTRYEFLLFNMGMIIRGTLLKV